MSKFVSNATMKIVANNTPDWAHWQVRDGGTETVFEFRASHVTSGADYACSYGMVDLEEADRIMTGVVGHKHNVTIEMLAKATGRQ